jgi:hypothetical protein
MTISSLVPEKWNHNGRSRMLNNVWRLTRNLDTLSTQEKLCLQALSAAAGSLIPVPYSSQRLAAGAAAGPSISAARL